MLNFIKENTQKFSSSVGSSLGEAQLSRYYNNVIQYIDTGEGQGQPQVDDPLSLTMSDYVQRIINKPNKVSEQEKAFLFEYAQTSPYQVTSGEPIDRFSKNLIIIINSFFEYGFMKQPLENQRSVVHYWELLTQYFSSYSSISFINEQLVNTHKDHEKALSWLILVLNEENVLLYCFQEIFNNESFLSHYDKQTSYFTLNQHQLLEIAKSVYQHKLLYNSALNQKYQESLRINLIRPADSKLGLPERSHLEFDSSDDSSDNSHETQNTHKEEFKDLSMEEQNKLDFQPPQEDSEKESSKEKERNSQEPLLYIQNLSSPRVSTELVHKEIGKRNQLELIADNNNFNSARERQIKEMNQRLNLFNSKELEDRNYIQQNLYITNKGCNIAITLDQSFSNNLSKPSLQNKHSQKSQIQMNQHSLRYREGQNIQSNQQTGSPKSCELESLTSLDSPFSITFGQLGEEQETLKKCRRAAQPTDTSRHNASFDSDALKIVTYDKTNYFFTFPERQFQRGTNEQGQPLKNSDIVFFNEFVDVLARKEYTKKQVQSFFTKNDRGDPEKHCHNCGTKINKFMVKIVRRTFCYFCMNYVCGKACLSGEQFIIPRNFNLEYDLKQRPVCCIAALFLNRKNLLKITYQHPQVSLQEELYQFMVQRRRVHKIYDMIKCDAWLNIMEKNSFAGEKNMILKDFIVSLQQLVDYQKGQLMKRLLLIEDKFIDHLQQCKQCSVNRRQCEICKGGVLYYDFEIEVAGECISCGRKGHLSCLRKHLCSIDSVTACGVQQ